MTIRFAWYDLWVGAFWDRKSRTLYICPLPCLLLTFSFQDVPGEFAKGSNPPSVPRSPGTDPSQSASTTAADAAS